MNLELPWEMPSGDDEDYKLWKTTDYASHSPWCKLDTLALSLVRKILIPTPSKRYNISQIQSHNWFIKSKTCGTFLFNQANYLKQNLIHIQVPSDF